MKEPKEFWLYKTSDGKWLVSEIKIDYYRQDDQGNLINQTIHVREINEEASDICTG